MSKKKNNTNTGRVSGEESTPGEIAGFSVDYRYEGTVDPVDSEPEPELDPELDDFLPEGESLPDDELLTKWEEKPQESAVLPRRRRRRRYGVATGAVVLLFALVGVAFLAVTIGSRIHDAATDDSRQRAYDELLKTVVMQDPQPFESPDKADPLVVQNASLWHTLLSDGGGNYTQMDDEGRVIVPLGDVMNSCHELFGPDRALLPQSPEQESFYVYNATDNNYHVTLFSSESAFTPYTETIKREGDSTVLRVGYVSPSDEWKTQTNSTVAKPSPTKYMEYVLKTNAGTKKEYVYAVRSAAD